MNGLNITITTWGSTKEDLKRRLDWILDLMDKEHHNCHTHSQRNAYQAVIRHELEIMRDQILHSRDGSNPATEEANNQIPF